LPVYELLPYEDMWTEEFCIIEHSDGVLNMSDISRKDLIEQGIQSFLVQLSLSLRYQILFHITWHIGALSLPVWHSFKLN